MMQIALDEQIPPVLALIEANMEGEYYAGEVCQIWFCPDKSLEFIAHSC